MKYKLKYHFAAAYVLAVVLAGFTSCEKRFEMDLPLAVSSHTLKFGTAGGSTHILVYSTGQWQISFDKKIDWGSLNKLSGEGNADFVFSYSDNYGVSRSVDLLLTSGELRDTIHLYQAGELLEPLLQFNTPELELDAGRQEVITPISTDLVYNIKDIVPSVKYFDSDGNELAEAEPWILNIAVSGTEVTYDVEENNTGADRKAELTLSITDADKISTIAIQTIVQKSK